LDFCDPDQVKVKAVLEELEIMLPKADGSGSDEESDGDSDYSGEEGERRKKKAGAVASQATTAGAPTAKPQQTTVNPTPGVGSGIPAATVKGKPSVQPKPKKE
jgi:hypothetical protein